ncbi:MAG: transcription-repair coupling factor [bacterium]|nr:transcription-repair coupling factor [bacterium]
MPMKRVYNRMIKSEPFTELARRIAEGEQEIHVRGLPGSLTAFGVAWVDGCAPGTVLVVCATEERAEEVRDDLERLLGPESVGIFPTWGGSVFDSRSPHLDVMGLRLEALDQIRCGTGGVVVAPIEALMSHTIPPDLFALCQQEIRTGQEVLLDELVDHLADIGYERVNLVEGVGQFSVRGGIVDICSFGNPHPVRLEFFGDEVTSIRGFDLGTQRSVETLDVVRILPCREAVLAETMAEEYTAHLEEAETRLGCDLTVLRETFESRRLFDGLERYLGVLYREQTCVLDHLPEGCVVVDDPPAVEEAAKELWEQVSTTADRQKAHRGQPEPLPAEGVIQRPEAVLDRLAGKQRILNWTLGGQTEGAILFNGKSGRRYEGHLDVLQEDLKKFWREDHELVLLCESKGQQARFEELLGETVSLMSIEVGTLHSGFTFVSSTARVVVLNDHEIYSLHRRRRKYRRFKDATPIRGVSALHKGDFVVHVDHGIGRYEGIEHLSLDGVRRDCLTVSYRGGDRVFVPVDQMDRVQKYASQEGNAPVLSKLGTATWERVKERTKKEVFKMAAELVGLYAERKARPGTAFSKDTALHNALDASFPFQETVDQLRTIEEVKADMEQPSPMDRLVCGDVGYGKTEVAIRAAFKAVADGKQVAVLAPTTILAQQHFRTFRERMNGLPVTVDVLSRFRTKAEQEATIRKLMSGNIDIVVGTHRLLSQDVQFQDLGILVVDEEHRFGVRHKERLKQMKRMVDVLTLTATPIPRTLHMSLMGARDMSIIRTPPKDRLPITTEVLPFNEERIAEAILREVDRGGQVYFVHNRVRSMPAMVEYLERLVPQVRFGWGHGQMPERQLEKVMMDFMEGKYDCLISTMIIESGLDIPSVNTLIVNQADRLGLAQLYQLRGRVGRSSQQAYAYLLIPSWKALSRPAVRRLRAIEEFSDLGSGFQISMRDMEIRGTGNLLGQQQHGHIVAIGFDLYCRLLDEAVQQIRGEDTEPAIEPDVQITVSAYIPEDYIPDSDLKMQFYQRVGECRRTVEILAIEEELEDRFGPLPESAAALLNTVQIKILARQLRVESLRVGTSLQLVFPPERMLTRVDVETMVAQSPVALQFFLGDQARVEAELEGKGPASRLASAKKVLQGMV